MAIVSQNDEKLLVSMLRWDIQANFYSLSINVVLIECLSSMRKQYVLNYPMLNCPATNDDSIFKWKLFFL